MGTPNSFAVQVLLLPRQARHPADRLNVNNGVTRPATCRRERPALNGHALIEGKQSVRSPRVHHVCIGGGMGRRGCLRCAADDSLEDQRPAQAGRLTRGVCFVLIRWSLLGVVLRGIKDFCGANRQRWSDRTSSSRIP